MRADPAAIPSGPTPHDFGGRRRHSSVVTVEVTVRARSNMLLGVCAGALPLIVAAAPVGSGVVRALWVLFWVGIVVVVIVRAVRMSVSASPSGLRVRNFGHDYVLPWSEVASIEAGRSDNVTRAVTTIVIHRVDGSRLIGRGASADRRQAVERWRDDLRGVQRAHS